jgi:hypothetical protein
VYIILAGSWVLPILLFLNAILLAFSLGSIRIDGISDKKSDYKAEGGLLKTGFSGNACLYIAWRVLGSDVIRRRLKPDYLRVERGLEIEPEAELMLERVIELFLRRVRDTARVSIVAAVGGAYNYYWYNRNRDGIGVLNREGTREYIIGINAYSED